MSDKELEVFSRGFGKKPRAQLYYRKTKGLNRDVKLLNLCLSIIYIIYESIRMVAGDVSFPGFIIFE